MNRYLLRYLPALLASVLLAACSREPADGSSNVLPSGFWAARITLPGGDIDAGIEISHRGGNYTASLINGQERVPIDNVSFADGELLLRFPAFNNEIRARLQDGRLVGELVLVKRGGATQSMPFTATRGHERTDAATEMKSDHDMSGRWMVQFHEADGSNTPAVGEFSQRGARLYGTFLTPTGDYRYLAGAVRGNTFKLSTFDGAHAFIFTGTLDGHHVRDGNFWSGTSWHQTWNATRDPQASLPDANSRTFLKEGQERLEFAFPDQHGRTVSLDDARFEGKVVVITLAGTWCPNCHDEARFMAPLYKAYRDKGLEVVALMYEHFDEHELAAEQVARFRKKFGIEYTTLIAGVSDKTAATDTLPALNAVLAFPTTIFIDRNGNVRRIHTGFAGPGTGEHHKRLTSSIKATIESLLAEPAATRS